MLKQYILVNKEALKDLDPKMVMGKLGVHAAHASSECCVTMIYSGRAGEALVSQWRNTGYTKILLGVKNLYQMIKIYKKVKDLPGQPKMTEDLGRYGCKAGEIFCYGIGPITPSEAASLGLDKLTLF